MAPADAAQALGLHCVEEARRDFESISEEEQT
jgi:hypothetical protein